MSYSLIAPCGECNKAPECSDAAVLSGAIYGIHVAGFQRGHKGAGTIKLDCMNKEVEQQSTDTVK